ncbi:protein translocase subunit SecD [Streptomyces sodiiphilus]|uniref:Protein translocase subunit SecD n=1 Tax=Streptomyces sodiiphilus TaxID=226217 RepID=A0ABN2NQB9_9ACTN
MATPNNDLRSSSRDRRSPAAQAKPGRALLLILLITVVLTGGMFLSGANTPRLGIDLAGGTSITLTATEDARNQNAVNQTNLETAASIIERRVNGLGVAEAEVQTQGDRNIVVSIPRGTDEEQAREQVGVTAQLGFRPVLSIDSAAPLPGGEEPAPDEEAVDPDAEGGEEQEGEDGEEERSDQSLRSPGATAPAGATTATHASFRTEDGEEATEDGEETEEPGEGAEDGTSEDEDGAENELLAQLAELDCTTPEARAEAGRAAAQVDDSEPIVACDTDGMAKYALGPVAVPGTDVTDASAVYETQRGMGWIVQLEFNSAGADKFADVTAELATQFQPQNQFAIVLDGEIVSAPSVSTRIGGGSAEISGSFTQESSEELANILKFGALPISFEEGNVVSVSPTLGAEQLKAGLIAGGIGLLLVLGYLVVYYRALAMVAVASLLAMAALSYVIMTLLGPAIGFALSLPAVCGAIVAIGITADSFIVYFERIRDEVREGRPVRPATERAWPRARRTILVSDMVSFLAAVVLFLVSVGSVQGFAFVLGLTTALDVLIVFLLTKPMVTLLMRRKFFASGHPWSGLDPKRLGMQPPLRRGRRRVTVPAEPKEA